MVPLQVHDGAETAPAVKMKAENVSLAHWENRWAQGMAIEMT